MTVWTYLKDRLPYVFFYFLSQVLIVLVAELALFRRHESVGTENLIYMAVLSITVLLFFLVVDFLRQWPLYKEFHSAREDSGLAGSLKLTSAVTREQKLFLELMAEQYRTYMNQLVDYEEERRRHHLFTNQWVHGMKTPVSVIDLSVQQGRAIQSLDEAKAIIESIGEENERIAHGLGMILHTARLENFEFDVSVTRLDLTGLVRDVINDLRKTMIRYEIYPSLDGTEEDVFVESDRKWLSFVVQQLTTNAIKYTAKKEGRKILYKIQKVGEAYLLEVKDEGIGIPVQDLPRVFDPFFTGENGRRGKESTGMGLYLAKEVCGKLGHKLTIDSVEGVGTTVKITFLNESIYRI